MGTQPYPVDLLKLWEDLGIKRENGAVTFDDSASLAAVRRRIVGRDS